MKPLEELLEEAVAYHGHLCAGQVLGVRMAILGLGLLGLVAFYLGHVLSDLSWYSLVGFLVARGRGLSAGLYRGLMLACALFLVFLGGFFVFSGLKYWLG